MKLNLFNFNRESQSRSFLLLEIGMLHVRLHSINAEQHPISIAVLRDESVTPGDMTLLFETVRNILDIDCALREIVIVMSSPSIRHQILSIPQLKTAERQKVLSYEMKSIAAPGETAVVLSHWSAGKIKRQDTSKEYVLCAEMNRSVADNMIAIVSEKKFNLIGFTSHAQMVSLLLKECRMKETANVALIEANDREGSITLFHSNIWNMDRQFLISAPTVQSDSQIRPGLDAEKVKLEVGRALQYFKQQVRNENISQIFLFGTTRHATDIKNVLESSFRIPVTLLAVESKIFGIKNSAGAQEEIQSLYGIAQAAARHVHFDRYISFLPPEWCAEKHDRVRRSALVATAVAYYALMGGLAYVIHREDTRITVLDQKGMQAPLVHSQTAQRMQQLQLNRSFALATEQSNQWLYRKHRILAELARELAAAIPQEMRITNLDVTEKGDAWQIRLQAEIRSENGSRSQQLLLNFQEKMQQLSCLKCLGWGEVRLGDVESVSLPRDQSSTTRLQNVLTFNMQGILHYTDLPENQQSNAHVRSVMD